MHAVIIIDQYGNEQVSRYFQTIKAARRWKKWLDSHINNFQARIRSDI